MHGYPPRVQDHRLANAFVIGAAATALLKSFIDNIVISVITFFFPRGARQKSNLAIRTIVIARGTFLFDLISSIIVAVIVFIIAKRC